MKIAIIQYNAGNVQSVLYALQRLGVNAVVTDNPAEITGADKVIFPGVGNAASAMEYLKRTGLDKVIVSLQQPVLGICLGLQLLCNQSEEGDTKCLGIFDVTVKKFQNAGHKQKMALLLKFRRWDGIQLPVFPRHYLMASRKIHLCIMYIVTMPNYRQ